MWTDFRAINYCIKLVMRLDFRRPENEKAVLNPPVWTLYFELLTDLQGFGIMKTMASH